MLSLHKLMNLLRDIRGGVEQHKSLIIPHKNTPKMKIATAMITQSL